MLRMAWRWLRIVVVATYSLTIWIGRELHPFIIGGFSKQDPRHPDQIQARIADREHDLFPDDHASTHCPACIAEVEEERAAYTERIRGLSLWERRTKQPISYWYCLDCLDAGEVKEGSAQYKGWRSHWLDTGHERYQDGFASYHSARNAARLSLLEDSP